MQERRRYERFLITVGTLPALSGGTGAAGRGRCTYYSQQVHLALGYPYRDANTQCPEAGKKVEKVFSQTLLYHGQGRQLSDLLFLAARRPAAPGNQKLGCLASKPSMWRIGARESVYRTRFKEPQTPG
ncbi:hypothetical protein LY76DRAFT_605222 [Colletotrichum caudatum]|nr:hypothetical protein LY76DRAFT_605222 [Colletotrichum caudatum]